MALNFFKVKCQICNDDIISTFKERLPRLYLTHIETHKRPHIPAESYIYWLYNWLKSLSILNKYETWEQWNKYDFRLYQKQVYFEVWQEYTKNTCRNIPCHKCINKLLTSTKSDKRIYTKNNKIEYILSEPRAYMTTKYSQKRYLDSL